MFAQGWIVGFVFGLVAYVLALVLRSEPIAAEQAVDVLANRSQHPRIVASIRES